jgi:DNA (cytosine-5)-methyltransferase 1
MTARVMSLDVYAASAERRPTAIDLFCGCGGFSVGLIQGGFDVLLGLDMDQAAMTSYMYNLGADDCQWVGELPDKRFRDKNWGGKDTPPLYGDDPRVAGEPAPEWALESLREQRDDLPWRRTVKVAMCKPIQEVHGWDIFELLGVEHIDAIVGGPPCQSFSMIGKREVGDERDNLMYEYVRLVQEIQPCYVAMEEVPAVVTKCTSRGINIFNVFKRLLSEPYDGPTAKSVLGLEDYRYNEGWMTSSGRRLGERIA